MSVTPGIMWGGALSRPTWRGREVVPAALFVMLREMGLAAIDIFARHVDQYGVGALREGLDSSGLHCACFYIHGDLLAGDDRQRREVDLAFEHGVESALGLGAPRCFTYGTQHTREGDEARAAYIERLREKAALVADAGMALVIENAGLLVNTPEHMLEVIDGAGDAGLRLCPDTGNFSVWGIDELDAIRRCLPWMAHIHLKDLSPGSVGDEAGRGVPEVLGRGVTPIAEIIALLDAERWPGVAAWEPGPTDEDGIEAGVAELLRLTGR